jgi:hydroxyacyl-ACP dehydratase HTD2-like protein with hotdog domain
VNALNDKYKQWIGRTESKVDFISSKGSNSLAATVDREKLECSKGDTLPPLWHWIFFLEMAPHRALSSDGHPRKGGFLPPIELPRRMWAGSRLTFHKPLQIDDEASKPQPSRVFNLRRDAAVVSPLFVLIMKFQTVPAYQSARSRILSIAIILRCLSVNLKRRQRQRSMITLYQ